MLEIGVSIRSRSHFRGGIGNWAIDTHPHREWGNVEGEGDRCTELS